MGDDETKSEEANELLRRELEQQADAAARGVIHARLVRLLDTQQELREVELMATLPGRQARKKKKKKSKRRDPNGDDDIDCLA